MLSTDQITALLVLADVYVGQGRAGTAATLLEGVHSLDPNNADVVKALSYACLTAGQHERALELAERYLTLRRAGPAEAPVLLIQSRALWELGRHDEAHERLRRFRGMTASS